MKSAIAFIALVVLAAMAFEIPAPYKWDESFAVGYQQLDDEHVGLFDAVRETCDHAADVPKLEHLAIVIDKHFRYEEGKMEDAHYAHYDDHVQKHHDFEERLKSIHVPVPDDECLYVKEWLVDHIKTIDFQYKTLL